MQQMIPVTGYVADDNGNLVLRQSLVAALSNGAITRGPVRIWGDDSGDLDDASGAWGRGTPTSLRINS